MTNIIEQKKQNSDIISEKAVEYFNNYTSVFSKDNQM